MDYTVLINKDNLLSSHYVPQDLVITDENENNFHNFNDPSLKPMIDKNVYSYFLKMQDDALKSGFHIIIDSGYRSYDYQKMVLDNLISKVGVEEANSLVAPPGASEHQSGLAFDVAYIINGNYSDKVEEKQIETKWLFENAYKYGFILRYPKGKEEITGYKFEPWHYRFVGLELANLLKEENITLEEYYLKKDYYDSLLETRIKVYKKRV